VSPLPSCCCCCRCIVMMFLKRKKKKACVLEISMPRDFQHRVHTSFDVATGRYVGLPKQWQSVIDTLRRPRPLVDPSSVTEVELTPEKTIVRGSFIGHGDYITHVISELSHLPVTSSNSLRRSSPSARKRAQSLGRLGQLAEGDSYQYEELICQDEHKNDRRSTYWQDRIRQVRSESGSPKLGGRRGSKLTAKDSLPRSKSTYEVGVPTAAAMPTPVIRVQQRTSSIGGHYTCSEGAWLTQQGQMGGVSHKISRQRPTSCQSNLPTTDTNARLNLREKAGISELPDLLTSARETPRMLHSSCGPKVKSHL
ncbi:hypothetical protein LDENG_00164600, partial [Lucifuga dentata]